MIIYWQKCFILTFLEIILFQQSFSQTPAKDTTFYPYHVNYWITCPIIGIGLSANLIGITGVKSKAEITALEIKALNKDVINSFDRWALNQDLSQINAYDDYSNFTNTTLIALPAILLFDKQVRKNWLDLILMYAEASFVTSNFFNFSVLGPSFQNRYRPLTYYDQLPIEQRKTGNNRNSFYSGHVATAAVSTFFIAKVYSDYHPEMGDNIYLLYAAATIPPLISGYFRVKSLHHFPSDAMVGLVVGASIGFIIPELHKIQDKNINLGLIANPESIGINLKWQPEFLK